MKPLGNRVFVALYRFTRRQKAMEWFIADRMAKAEEARRQAFESPPMTPSERRRYDQERRAEVARAEARRAAKQ